MATKSGGQEKHKAGPLKQQNKIHKHGRHRTKGQMDMQNKGKVSVKQSSRKVNKMDKRERRNQAKQLRMNKRDAVVEKKRASSAGPDPPHIMVVLPLTLNCNITTAVDHLLANDDNQDKATNKDSQIIICEKTRQRYKCLCPPGDNLFAVLDAAKVANTVVFLVKCNEPFSPNAERLLPCLLGQGLPTTIVAIQGVSMLAIKRQSEAKKNISKLMSKWMPDVKLQALDSAQDGKIMLRTCSNQKGRSVFYRENRPYMMAEKMEFVPNAEDERGTLKVTGFVRSKPLSVNGLVHVVGIGDFQLKQIDSAQDPYPRQTRNTSLHGDAQMSDETVETKVLAIPNPILQQTLQSEAEIDPMEGEQTWPLEEELEEAEENYKNLMKVNNKKSIKVPKGTSDYQASWIIDNDNGSGSEEDTDDEDDAMAMANDDIDSAGSDDEEDDFDTASVSTICPQEDKYDQQMDLDEEEMQLQKYKEERDHELFPDEVDTPRGTTARTRFQKYRGLKSFRSSPWDPKENLPMNYARIFQFQNFMRMKRRILKDNDGLDSEGALPGWYITLHVANVPKSAADNINPLAPLVVFGLLPHEQRMTMMHFVVMRDQCYHDAVKSKDQLIICAGYRRFSANPIFSQHTNGEKFKLERFLPHEKIAVVMTTYAPVFFPPAPVLVMDKAHRLVAKGTVFKSDPDRIVTKKAVLSGHPYKINKRTVVVRYMFFNKEDVTWFKPVELYTKFGRRGNIKETLGTHGHMKCVFDGKFDAKDTVCLPLYKRMYPKWTYNACVPAASQMEIEDNVMES